MTMKVDQVLKLIDLQIKDFRVCFLHLIVQNLRPSQNKETNLSDLEFMEIVKQ